MKLLFCPSCSDLFKLSKEPKSCACKKVRGYYNNNLEAIVNGEGISLAIDNNDILKVLRSNSKIIKNHYITCWIRPHEGVLNPNTKMDKDI